jgi:hypothetical protein
VNRAIPPSAIVIATALAVWVVVGLTSRGGGEIRAAEAPDVVQVLKPIAALPIAIATALPEPIAFVETSSGDEVILDRKQSSLFLVDAARADARRIVGSGPGPSGLTSPSALALSSADLIAVADVVNDVNRIQYFSPRGARVGGFYLPDRPRAHVSYGGLAINQINALVFERQSFFVNLPSRGQLISELDASGQTVRQIGALRATGQPPNPDLDALLNIGVPVRAPDGGFYFIFETGVPMFRKYDATGALVFERHIEGPELDGALQRLPTVWRLDGPDAGALPIIQPLVRTAAVDRLGRLWISLAAPYTYVYDARGDKIRTVAFHATGPIAVRSLFFADRDRVLVTPGCYEFSAK